MKFEQAFYTRDSDQLNQKEPGLGIRASSNPDSRFLKGCMDVGGALNTENSDQMAQLVYYSDYFQNFVGIGISRAHYPDGGNRNKLCHLFVPMQEAAEGGGLDPCEYDLDYPFQDQVEKKCELPQITLQPCLNMGCYTDRLNTYFSDKKKLAEFLYRLFPVLFSEKNQLQIVLDQRLHTEKEQAVIAREVTWLAGMLVPAEGALADQCRKRLSYGVHVSENAGIVNIVYSCDENLCADRFYLDRGADGEIKEWPELYDALAEHAADPVRYRFWIRQLSEGRTDALAGTSGFLEAYADWKVRNGYKISMNELPGSMQQMLIRAQNDDAYAWKLIGYLSQIEEIGSVNLMIDMWKDLIQPRLDPVSEESADVLCRAAERLIVLMYDRNQTNYRIFLKRIPQTVRGRIFEHLYTQQNSCIRRQLEEIQTVEEFLEASDFYQCLRMNREYQNQMKEIAGRNLSTENIPEKIREEVIGYCSVCNQEDPDGLERQIRKIKRLCREDVAVMLYASYILGAKQYSIWTEFSCYLNIEKYEEIYREVRKASFYQEIEAAPSEKADSELNRVCYGLWKHVYEKKGFKRHILDNFNQKELRQKKKNFLDKLVWMVTERSDPQDGILYFRLKLEQEDLPEYQDMTREKRYQEYEAFHKKDPVFYQRLLDAADTYNPQMPEEEELKNRLYEFRVFHESLSSFDSKTLDELQQAIRENERAYQMLAKLLRDSDQYQPEPGTRNIAYNTAYDKDYLRQILYVMEETDYLLQGILPEGRKKNRITAGEQPVYPALPDAQSLPDVQMDQRREDRAATKPVFDENITKPLSAKDTTERRSSGNITGYGTDTGAMGCRSDTIVTGCGTDTGAMGCRSDTVVTGYGTDTGVTGYGTDTGVTGYGSDRPAADWMSGESRRKEASYRAAAGRNMDIQMKDNRKDDRKYNEDYLEF